MTGAAWVASHATLVGRGRLGRDPGRDARIWFGAPRGCHPRGAVARDRRRRRTAPGGGLRALRHRPRAVHRRLPRREASRSFLVTNRSASSRRSARGRRAVGCGAGRRLRSRCSCRAGPVPRALGTYRHCQSAMASPTCTGNIPAGPAPGLWGGYATHQTSPPTPCCCRSRRPRIRWWRHCSTLAPVSAGPSRCPSPAGRRRGGARTGVRGLSAVVALRQAGAGFVLVTPRTRDAADSMSR